MIPSLLQIPSAVSDSKLHSVLPNNGKGDFQFDRSTGATRINKDGLIEEVGYFSSELVQNGNFSELGSELVTNGDFATDSDWTKGGSWIINNGKASIDYNDGSDGRLTQGISFTQNKTYKIVFTISNYVSGNFRIEFRFGGSSTVSSNFNANGTYTLYLTAGQNHTQFSIRSLSNPIGSIDNVSVKQVDPNDRWTLGTGWSYGDGVVSSDGSQSGNSDCTQNLSTPTGKTYKVTYTISQYSAGGVFIRLASGNVTTTQTSAGTFSEILNGADGTQVKIRANSTFVGTISNISVVEVQGDRPRLSYDITNGVVEDQPHLLLEPSSTNLVTFSNDYTQSSWIKSNFTANTETTIAPDGTTISGYDFGDGFLYIDLPAMVNGASYTNSVYIKANKNATIGLRNGGAGGSTNDTNINLTTSWQRFTATSSATNTNAGRLLIDNRAIKGFGVSDLKVFVYGAQNEQLSFATSFIPTAGTTITRAAETCNNSKPSVNSTEGVLYAEIAALNESQAVTTLSISDSSLSNRVLIALTGGELRGQFVSSANNVNKDTSGATIINYNKIACLYTSTTFKVFVNGSQVGTTSTGLTALSGIIEVAFDRGDGGLDFIGKVKGLAVYNEALTDAQLIELTS